MPVRGRVAAATVVTGRGPMVVGGMLAGLVAVVVVVAGSSMATANEASLAGATVEANTAETVKVYGVLWVIEGRSTAVVVPDTSMVWPVGSTVTWYPSTVSGVSGGVQLTCTP